MKRILLVVFVALVLTVAIAYAVPLTPGVSPVATTTTDNVFIKVNWTPSSKTDNCVKGRFGFDNSFVYWCYSDNNINRAAFDNTW